MVESWTRILGRMLSNLGNLTDDLPDAENALKGLKKIRVACDIRCVSDTPEEVPGTGPFDRLIAHQAKRAGISVLEQAKVPCLWSLIHFARVFSGRNIYLFSLQTRLIKVTRSSDTGGMQVDGTVLWRAVPVGGISTERGVWHDIGQVLYGQLDQFVSAHREANRADLCRFSGSFGA